MLMHLEIHIGLISIKEFPDAINLHNKIGEKNKWTSVMPRLALLNVRADRRIRRFRLYESVILLLYRVRPALPMLVLHLL